MKKKNYLVLIALVALLISSSSVYGQKAGKSRYVPRENKQQPAATGFTGALEFYKSIRNNPVTGEFHYEDYYAARKDVELFGANKTSVLNWHSIGPTDQGGRVRAILFDKNNNEVMYAGAVSGGLWKTTNGGQSWQPIDDMMQNLIVSCVAQAPNGIIYFGTGEGFAPSFGSTAGSTGFVGMGLFKSTDATGTTFEQITSTNPTTTNGWQYVYRVKVHNNGDIYAATQKGIKKSTDGGATWTNPLASFSATEVEAHDIDISPNGNVISLVVGRKVYISTDAGANYFNASTGGATLPATGLSRIEVDIAPSNPNFIYACAAKTNGALHNVYRTTDGGQTWTIIGPGGSENFSIFGSNNQGYYDNVIKVHPTNPDKIFVGGIDKWQWEANGNWEQKSLWFLSNFSAFYLHADQHEYVFHPQNPNIVYYGTDGGISKSTNGGNTFETVNRNFTTLQSYAMAVSKEGMIMTGTQDNGTLLMDRKGFIEGKSRAILGGDGGYCAFSFLNEKLYFAAVYYGDVNRTPTADAEGMSQFYDSWVQGLSGFGTVGFASFVTPFVLHEKIDDHLSPDTAVYTHIGSPVYSGDTIYVPSGTSGYLFPYVLPAEVDSLLEDDKITVQDIVTSKFYVGINGYVLMTRESHNFASIPEWWPVAKITGTVQSMAVSKCGNYLYVGTNFGKLYRISNLDYANDYLSASALDITVNTPYPINPFCVVETKDLSFSAANGRPINNIAIDPNDPSRIIVCLGNYGSSLQFVYYSSNALDETPTFVSKQGALPRVPVYSAIIELSNPNTVLLGTEFGIYMTTNINAASPTWTEENSGGMARVPVYDMKQQVFWLPGVTNYGAIYAATHGRGVYESMSFVTVPETEKPEQVKLSKLEVYPNPASDEITLRLPVDNNSKLVRIFNISGKTMHQVRLNNAGSPTATINISSLPAGTYIIELSGDQFRQTGKFIKVNQ
jgi:photosystem II stability/assembly factor-like uncharacterized protein